MYLKVWTRAGVPLHDWCIQSSLLRREILVATIEAPLSVRTTRLHIHATWREVLSSRYQLPLPMLQIPRFSYEQEPGNLCMRGAKMPASMRRTCSSKLRYSVYAHRHELFSNPSLWLHGTECFTSCQQLDPQQDRCHGVGKFSVHQARGCFFAQRLAYSCNGSFRHGTTLSEDRHRTRIGYAPDLDALSSA